MKNSPIEGMKVRMMPDNSPGSVSFQRNRTERAEGRGAKVARGFHQAPIHFFRAGIHSQNHELQKRIHHAHHHGGVVYSSFRGNW